jgi:hypothetical protein
MKDTDRNTNTLSNFSFIGGLFGRKSVEMNLVGLILLAGNGDSDELFALKPILSTIYFLSFVSYLIILILP